MATRIDFSGRPILRKGTEIELLHGLEMYHTIIADSKQKDIGCLHAGVFRVEAIDRDKGALLLAHLDPEDPHYHRIEGIPNIVTIEEVTSIPDGFYAWFYPPSERGGPMVPYQVFEVRGQRFKDLGQEEAPSGSLIIRHTYKVISALESEAARRLYALDPKEAADVAERLRQDETAGVGDYLFLHGQFPGKIEDVPLEDVTAEPSVYLRLLDVDDVKGELYAIARVLGKWTRHNNWRIFGPNDIHPFGGERIDFSETIDRVGDLAVGEVYAFPFHEPNYSRRDSLLTVQRLKETPEWEHFEGEEQPPQGCLF